MNNKIFSSGDYYDLFYDDKNYQLEANYIHEKIQEYKSNSKSILEFPEIFIMSLLIFLNSLVVLL